jgi:flavin-dependent dehydrogenase
MEKKVIAGAGISGLTAAINLAKAGYKATVYEKNKKVGERFHGDFQGLENWTSEENALDALKRMNIDVNFPATPSKKFRVYDSSLKFAEIKSKSPIYYLVRRGHFADTLDSGLYKQAKKSGVKIIFNRLIDENSADIVATGPRYCDGIAKGVSFNTDIPDCAYVLADKKSAPQAYSYLLVNKGRGVVVSCIATHFLDIDSAFNDTLRKFKKIRKFSMKNKKDFGGYVSFFLQNSAKEGKRLFVGEAAGFQDYLFGFGMRYAITSGYLAAKSIIENKDYDRLWKKEFGKKLRIGVANRFLFERMENIEVKALEMLSGVFDGRKVWNKLYGSSLLNILVYPIAKRIMKSRRKCRRGCACVWCREKSQQR